MPEEEYRGVNSVECPHCNDDLIISGGGTWDANLVTYWGEGGPYRYECEFCGRGFWVKEKLVRTWKVGYTEEELLD